MEEFYSYIEKNLQKRQNRGKLQQQQYWTPHRIIFGPPTFSEKNRQ